MSEALKVTVPRDLKDLMKNRADSLGMSIPEYLRTLANLDINIQKYQELAIYLNLLYNRINETHNILNIHCMPLQEVPIVKVEELI